VGSHAAVPCLDCHKKQEKWNFRGIGLKCADCHQDIHSAFIQKKYYPESNCLACHNENRWSAVSFDHSTTLFSLTGAHKGQECRACHFRPDQEGIIKQKFSGLSQNCLNCHQDNHHGQFAIDGITNCIDCHGTEDWKASGFDHNRAAFRLDGKHINVPCAECHKPHKDGDISFIRYKLKEFKCESCH